MSSLVYKYAAAGRKGLLFVPLTILLEQLKCIHNRLGGFF